MIHDENKGIDLEYNKLNLPKLITFRKTPYEDYRIEYEYAWGGAKLRKNLYNDALYDIKVGDLTGSTYYNGKAVYEDSALKYLFTSEGRITYDDTNKVYEFVYDISDYLGNTRVSFKPAANGPDIIQEDHYYPFGMKMPGLCSVYDDPETKFTGGGKELEDDYFLNPLSDDGYHYGARYYDPQLCRWQQVDPVQEFHSPYLYCRNNPVNCIDPDGSTTVLRNDGTYYYEDDGIGPEWGAYEDDYLEQGVDASTINMAFINLDDINAEVEELRNDFDRLYSEDPWKNIPPGFWFIAQKADSDFHENVDIPAENKVHYVVADMGKWYRSDQINYIGIGALYRENLILTEFDMVTDIHLWKLTHIFKYREFPANSGAIYWAKYGYRYKTK